MTDLFSTGPLQKDMRHSSEKEMPSAEIILWSRLRRGPLLEHRFRRQYSVGPYFIDFYCVQAKLAIELDGDSHFSPESKRYDAQRQGYIESFGIPIPRFTNVEIYRQP